MSVLSIIKPKRILDIGSGEGKYGRLLRARSEFDHTHLTSVEYEKEREKQLLSVGYNEVRCISALDLLESSAENYEVVILGDVIEHFKKSEGMDLLNFLNYRSEYIIIITPEAMPMSSANFYEGHNSLWRPHDMQWHDYWLHMRCGIMHFYVLRGYLNFSGVSLISIQNAVHKENIIVTRGDTRLVDQNTIHQYARLDLHNTQIFDQIPGDENMVTIYRPN
jgi:hypothetical protein